MTKTIAVAGKGGTGKTTVVGSLACLAEWPDLDPAIVNVKNRAAAHA